MTAIYTPLDPDEAKALLRLSLQEKRAPRDQAAYLIRQSLINAGLLQPIQLIEKMEVAIDGRGN